MEHLDVGPLYCETPLGVAGAFPIEFVNTITSLIPSLFGLLAILYLYHHRSRAYELYALAGLAVATGLGSAWWHGARTGISLAFDVFPGLMYFLLLTALWPMALMRKWWWGPATVFGLFAVQFGLAYLLPLGESNGPPLTVFGGTLLVAAALVWVTYLRAKEAVPYALLMLGSALLAAFMRTIDLHTCDYISFGTHFLWHVFLGFAAYLGVRLIAKIYEVRKLPVDAQTDNA